MTELLHQRIILQCKVYIPFLGSLWKLISFVPSCVPCIQFINNTTMSLLILLAVSHLIICFPAEKCYQGDGHLPLFHTGSGRSVTVSKSSIKRASAILEPRNIAKELEGTSFSKHHHITILYLLCTCMFLIPDKHVSYRDLLR